MKREGRRRGPTRRNRYRPKRELQASRLKAPGLAVASVDGVYQDALVSQLKNGVARLASRLPRRDYVRAHPQACDRGDVHFGQPGVPDYAVDAWLSWIASGLEGA